MRILVFYIHFVFNLCSGSWDQQGGGSDSRLTHAQYVLCLLHSPMVFFMLHYVCISCTTVGRISVVFAILGTLNLKHGKRYLQSEMTISCQTTYTAFFINELGSLWGGGRRMYTQQCSEVRAWIWGARDETIDDHLQCKHPTCWTFPPDLNCTLLKQWSHLSYLFGLFVF